MADVFRRAAARSDVVLVSGGLGPTRDDLTIEVLADTFGRELVLHEPSLEALRGFFARFGREMAEINAKQAWFPGRRRGARRTRSAPRRARCSRFPEKRRPALFFCMPGVPRELYKMMDEQVLPRIASRAPRRELGARVAAAHLRDRRVESRRDAARPRARRAASSSASARSSRTTTCAPSRAPRARRRRTPDSRARATLIRERLGALVYGEGEETLEAVPARLLAERG